MSEHTALLADPGGRASVLEFAARTTPLAGALPWCGARVSARAPAAACAVETRVFVGGAPGCVFARNLSLHELQGE